MTKATLRPAVTADIRAIAEFQTRCWLQAYRGLVPPDYLDRMSVDHRESTWGQRLATGSRQIAVAEIDADHAENADHTGNAGTAENATLAAHAVLIGVVSWGPARAEDGAPPLELKSLYVDAAHHGSGVAAALLRFAIGEADAQLWCFEENQRARAFYAKHGFQPDGTRIVDSDTGVWELRLRRSSPV